MKIPYFFLFIDEKEEPNPWLAQSSVMTTSLDSLPGSFTLPSKFSGECSKDIWLSKPAVAKQAESLAKGKSHSKKLITTLLSQ